MRVALWLALCCVALALGGLAPGVSRAETPAAPAPSITVILAHGLKPAPLFGKGELTPLDPGSSFVSTDLPYAILRGKSLAPGSTVALRLTDPTGVAYEVDVKTPPHGGQKVWTTFDFAAPLYILGTDLESHTGTWRLDVQLDQQPMGTTEFQWGQAAPADLPKIKAVVDQAPTNADLRWRYGAALALFGQLPDAVTELQNAIRLDSNYALYDITLGRVYQAMGRTDDAAQQFQRALTLHGSMFDAVFASWARADLARLPGH